MKIGTDSVLLGAWVSCDTETRILDIGTGSGILALMMAQRNSKTEIDAVEIDADAAALAGHNIQLSPWPDQVKIFNTSIQEFTGKNKIAYSLIISNPPFFTNSLKAAGKSRNIARHNDTLPVNDLLSCTAKLLTSTGKASFILPAEDFGNWKSKASGYDLLPTHITWVKSSPTHIPHRVMVTFAPDSSHEFLENEICIYTNEKKYSKEYRILTGNFYLKF